MSTLPTPTLLTRPFRFIALAAAAALGLPVSPIAAVPQYAGVGTPRTFRWDYTFTGTALATVTVNLEGNDVSPQFTGTWEILDQGTSVTGEAGRNVVNKNPLFVRVRVAVATGGDATSAISAGLRSN